MNRRNLLTSALSAGIVCAVPIVARASVKKYGCLDVDGHRAHMKTTGEHLVVYLDGVEVKQCYEADDINGYVKAFCTDQQEHRRLDAKGAMHLNSDGMYACRLEVHGSVVMIPKDKA